MSVASADAALLVVDVAKRYGALVALNNVSLHVDSGEFVVLLGPNGAGKTTLFQLLSGLYTPDAGEIRVWQQDMRVTPLPALAALGIVFQQPTLDLDLSVAANLRFHARLHGVDAGEREARIDASLARFGLQDQRRRKCRELSGGNRRKVELARALLHEPRVLLLDEPTVGLDPESRRAMLEHVHELCATQEIAVLWATHLVDEADDADRVCILHRAELRASGSPDAVIRQAQADSLLDAFLDLTAEPSA